MLNLVLFGPPGAGKGTQAEFLIKNYQLIHLSTGDLLRNEISANTPLGNEAKSYMDKGELVPDSVVIGMIENKLLTHKEANGFIFDGFPRTVEQARALDELLDRNNTPISGMLSLEVEEQELMERLLKRGEVSGRPDDRDLSVIKNRIEVYRQKTYPLIDHYGSQQKHFSINGMGTIEEIAVRLRETIQQLRK